MTTPDSPSPASRVEAPADRWAVLDRNPGKTVRAEPDLLY